MVGKNFKWDYFTRCIPTWEQYLASMKGKPDLKFLEVGSFEGRSACWFLDNILTDLSSTLTCIDYFEDTISQGIWTKELYENTYNMPEIHQNFLHNTKEYGAKVSCVLGDSKQILRQFDRKETFDCIYIDGSHIASDVLEDIVLSFPLLKVNGLLILDDYYWDMWKNQLREPKIAIDAFLQIYQNQYNLLLKDRQVILSKNGKKEG